MLRFRAVTQSKICERGKERCESARSARLKCFSDGSAWILGVYCDDEAQVRIEFVLPGDMLSHPVDQWSDPTGDPLGTYLTIAVRSRERLRNALARFGWQSSWQNLMARRQDMMGVINDLW